MDKLTRTTVLITGAAKRLGLSLAKASIERGLDVIVHYRSSKKEAESWLRRTPSARKRVRFVQGDLLDSSVDIVAAASRLTTHLGGLVNSASVFAKGDLRDPDHFRTTLEINALAPFRLAESFRRRVQRGWIVNITDAHIEPINLTYQNYRISKLLLGELTRQMAARYAPAIRVNAIAPGAILPAPGDTHRSFSRLAKEIPLKRTGNPQAVVKAYAYLLDNDYVTGETLHVDGGWHL